MLFSKRLYFVALFLFTTVFTAPVFAGVTPQEIQAYIAQANPAKALRLLAPILKDDPHSAKAWYLEAEALDAQGNTPSAKAALLTAEHLSPAMSFANPTDLKRLEQRVGVNNVASARATSHLISIIGLVAMVLLGIFGVFMFAWFKKNKQQDSVMEKRRSDILIAITTFISEDLKRALISANASEDSVKESAIQQWTTSLLGLAQSLKNCETASRDEKMSVITTAEKLLATTRDALSNNKYAIIKWEQDSSFSRKWEQDSLGSQDLVAGTSSSVGRSIGSSFNQNSAGSYAQPQNYGSGGGFVDALESGVGLGIGMTLAEDLVDGVLGRDSFESGNQDGFGVDNSFGSNQDDFGYGGNSAGNQDGFGGTDDGLSGGSDSFGGTDDGLTDSSGGSDDGFADDSSSDDSW